MKKRIIVSAVCVNEFASDVPEFFTLEITASLANRIKELSQLVQKADVYSVEEFNYEGTWSDKFLDPSEVGDQDSDLSNLVEELEQAESRVDVRMLRVTKDHFYFTATPKHCGDDMALSTRRLDISELDNPNQLIVIE